MRKRGRYFDYLRSNTLKRKIPRQTIWNRRNAILHTNSGRKIGSTREELQSSNNNLSISVVADYSQIENNLTNIDENIISTPSEVNISMVADRSAVSEVQLLENDLISVIDEPTEMDISMSSIEESEGNVFENEENEEIEENELEFCIEYFRKIHNKLECTVGDAFSLIYAYSVRHNLNWKATWCD